MKKTYLLMTTFFLLSSSIRADLFEVDHFAYSELIIPKLHKYMSQKDDAAEIRLLRAYIQKFKPGNPWPRLLLIRSYYRIGKYKEAGLLGDQLIKEFQDIGNRTDYNILRTALPFNYIYIAVLAYHKAGFNDKADSLQTKQTWKLKTKI